MPLLSIFTAEQLWEISTGVTLSSPPCSYQETETIFSFFFLFSLVRKHRLWWLTGRATAPWAAPPAAWPRPKNTTGIANTWSHWWPEARTARMVAVQESPGYTPARTLRSSDTGLLQVTRSSHKKIGDAAFVNYAPKLWNTLPINIREANTLDTFRRLFTKAFY